MTREICAIVGMNDRVRDGYAFPLTASLWA